MDLRLKISLLIIFEFAPNPNFDSLESFIVFNSSMPIFFKFVMFEHSEVLKQSTIIGSLN